MMQPSPPFDCAQTVAALWDFLDRETPPSMAAAIEAHLAGCADCRAHFRFEQRLKGELAALAEPHPDPASLRARVLGMLEAAGLGA